MPKLNEKQIKTFNSDGYVIARKFFSNQEIDLLRKTIIQDQEITKRSFRRKDGEGGAICYLVWNHPGESLYGIFSRCERIVDSVESLLDDEVYHYHSKLILKEPRFGGAWEWHQDYGYWYHFGCLFPMMASVSITIDQATRGNGCIQILKGSHLIGRIDHILDGDQMAADPEVILAACERLELIFCEMNPGDVLFFHCKTIHRSDHNHSSNPRRSLICSFNAKRNNPYKNSQHPRYTPLVKVKDRLIINKGLKGFSTNEDWMNPDEAMKYRKSIFGS